MVVYPPLWKIWKSIGMISNPIYGKIENGNQTTKKYYTIESWISWISYMTNGIYSTGFRLSQWHCNVTAQHMTDQVPRKMRRRVGVNHAVPPDKVADQLVVQTMASAIHVFCCFQSWMLWMQKKTAVNLSLRFFVTGPIQDTLGKKTTLNSAAHVCSQ